VLNLANRYSLWRIVFHARRLGAMLMPNPQHELAERIGEDFHRQVWEDAAAQLGASCKELGYGFCEIRRNGVATRVAHNRTGIDDPITISIALNKALVDRLLAEAGLPVPRHVIFTLRTLAKAGDFLAEIGEGVVKPAGGTGGGNGITTGIRTPWQLAWAATLAARYDGEMLLEQQIPGNNYRLLYLDGVLLDAVKRCPPSVIGNGRCTIRQLVASANEARLRRGAALRQVVMTIDSEMRHTLTRQGLSLSSVPADGVSIPVKTVINQNFGSDNLTVTDGINPSIVADGARAAQLLGVRFAGIDIITRDHTVPLADSGGVILEVNAKPGFHCHYHKADGSFPMAVRVLERLLEEK
jgi:cyanophycin synthetase